MAQRQQSLMGFVAADLSLRIADPPLQDVTPIVDQPGLPSRRRQPGIAVIDRLLHRVVRTTTQFCRGAIGPGQVVGIEYFHELSVRLQVGLSWGASIRLGIDIETAGEAATALARRAV
jgi:hypothetical protein